MDIKEIYPMPKLSDCKKLLCIQPHPDDMDIGAAGTLSYLADTGVEIHYLSVTDDAAGFLTSDVSEMELRKKQRKQEQEDAGKVIGIKACHWLDFPDAGNWALYDARQKIVTKIREIRPDFVMTIDPWLAYEAHQDHIKTGFAATEAFVLYNFPFVGIDDTPPEEYVSFDLKGVIFTFTSKPNTIIDVTKYHERKFEAIAKHESQFSKESLNTLKAYDTIRCKKLAIDKPFELGEGFKIIHPELLHIIPEVADY